MSFHGTYSLTSRKSINLSDLGTCAILQEPWPAPLKNESSGTHRTATTDPSACGPRDDSRRRCATICQNAAREPAHREQAYIYFTAGVKRVFREAADEQKQIPRSPRRPRDDNLELLGAPVCVATAGANQAGFCAAAWARMAWDSSRLGPYRPGVWPPAKRHISANWPR